MVCTSEENFTTAQYCITVGSPAAGTLHRVHHNLAKTGIPHVALDSWHNLLFTIGLFI